MTRFRQYFRGLYIYLRYIEVRHKSEIHHTNIMADFTLTGVDKSDICMLYAMPMTIMDMG